MSRRVVALVAVAAVALLAAQARADVPSAQQVTIIASDGTPLVCELVLPSGSAPSSGWPGLLLFPGLGLAPAAWEGAQLDLFAPDGFASLACSPRGSGGSGGTFDLDGEQDVRDVRDVFNWLTARPDVSDTAIGAFGLALGGAEVWNAAVAGVPFKAIVPGLTWTSLGRALTPHGVVKKNLFDVITHVGAPLSNWDPTLTQAGADLSRGQVTSAVAQALQARSSRSRLHTLTVPTLMIQSRHDLLFDLEQATAAYKLLGGPKRLYVGPPTQALPEIAAWFEQYLVGGTPVGGGVELTHGPWDGTTTSFAGLPATRDVSVNLPGATAVRSGVVSRSVRLPGGPLETFGAGSITVRYSGASAAWRQIVATVLVNGKAAPVTEGAAPLTTASGVLRIPLLDTAVLLPRGKRLTVIIAPRSGLFGEPAPSPSQRAITITRVTLQLSVLQRAVSK